MDEIDIEGIDEAELLAALYNNARPMGMGYLRAQSGDMTIEQAREIIDVGDDHQRDFPGIRDKPISGFHVDYVRGRPIKVEVCEGKLRGAQLYDRDWGNGACARIVEGLRAKRGGG